MKVPAHTISLSVSLALSEDVGDGDVTAALVREGPATARLITREQAVLCGRAWLDETMRQIDPEISVTWAFEDGDDVAAGATLCKISGQAAAILTAERTALNFLQLLSGVATVTRRYAERVAGTATQILDTRKTLPGLRLAQKYAVLCGGGTNHRIGLYDAYLIKENHIEAAGSISAAVARAREMRPDLLVEVEVEDFEQLDEALEAGVDRIMLDNFSLEQTRQAVQHTASRCKLEASGGLEIDDLRALAETGVDYISIGALTKHVRAIDLSLRF